MTADYLNDLTIFLNNLTDIQLAVLRGKIDEEQKNRDNKKIEEYYNRFTDLIDEINDSGFTIYDGNFNIFEASNLTIRVAERA